MIFQEPKIILTFFKNNSNKLYCSTLLVKIYLSIKFHETFQEHPITGDDWSLLN